VYGPVTFKFLALSSCSIVLKLYLLLGLAADALPADTSCSPPLYLSHESVSMDRRRLVIGLPFDNCDVVLGGRLNKSWPIINIAITFFTRVLRVTMTL